MSDVSMRGPTPQCLTALAVDEWNAGDDPPELRARAAEHLRSCEHCTARVAQATAQTEAFLLDAPSLEALGGQVRGAGTPGGGSVLRFPRAAGLVAGALAAAAAALLALRPGVEPESSTRSKGDAHLGVYIKRGDKVLHGADGDQVHPGDRLRFTYTSRAASFLSVWGSDGSALQLYHPEAGRPIPRLAPGRDHALDFGVALDGAAGTETFFGVFCSTPVAAETIRAALEAAQPAAPADCQLDVLRLPKDRP